MNRETVIASIGEFSVTPRIIRHLAKLVNDPNTDLTETIQAIKAEPVLATAVIAACNAPTHHRGGRTVDVAEAVHRLGSRETSRILLLITFRQGLSLRGLPDNHVADYLWRRAIVAACAMEELVKDPALRPPAYVIGLLHLIGCFVLARSGYPSGAFFDGTSHRALAAAQLACCGIDYPEAGATALEHWHFPASIHRPIRWQLAPLEAREHIDSAALLARAVGIAQFVEASRPDQSGDAMEPSTHVDPVVRLIEVQANELMERFEFADLPRPIWAIQR